MKRRDVLAGTGALAAAALAGCLSDPVGQEPPQGGTTPTDSEDAGGNGGSTDGGNDGGGGDGDGNGGGGCGDGTPSNVSFEVRSVQSGQGENSASVTFDDDEVTVDGTIGGRNGCYTARLASVEQSEGTLRVDVGSYEDKGEDEACIQGLVDIDYVAAIAFDQCLPERVVVEHESLGETHTVADESR
jgi:hypothetical protein